MIRSLTPIVAIIGVSLTLLGCASTADEATNANRATATVFRITVPDGAGRARQGVATLVDSGDFVTAAHVICEPSTGRVCDLSMAQFQAMGQQGTARLLPAGGTARLSASADVAFIKPNQPISSRGVPITPGALPLGTNVLAHLMSTSRGEFAMGAAFGQVVAYSTDGQYFLAATGTSVPGDSGGPVFDVPGNLAGMVVSGGSGVVTNPFFISKSAGGFQLATQGFPVYQGPFIICTRVLR